MAVKSKDLNRLSNYINGWTGVIVGAVEHVIDTYLVTNEAGGSGAKNAYVIYLPFIPSDDFKEQLIAKYKSGWRKVIFEDKPDFGGTVIKLYSLY